MGTVPMDVDMAKMKAMVSKFNVLTEKWKKKAKAKKCFECGSTDHLKKDCPKIGKKN